jgi:hypothetical protein
MKGIKTHHIINDKFLKEVGQTIKSFLKLLVPADLVHPLIKIHVISFKYCGLMPPKPGEKPAGKELINNFSNVLLIDY